jgi:SAM-dependent methyltransferase
MLQRATARNRSAISAGHVILQRGDFAALPFTANSMDGVLAVNVAYFWERAESITSEIRRVLRPGGRLALYVTERSTMQHWGFASHGTHRYWDAPALSDMLRAGGFPAAATVIRKVRLRSGVEGLLAVAAAP